ncbi:MAG TPA: penicillin acylase family protein [Bryobacteraceae bacterium]|jgi:penicillin amidase|nr:penicillin acylase family protein [Bryobacteraceae bacterium]
MKTALLPLAGVISVLCLLSPRGWAAPPSQTLSLSGLRQPVEIVKDHWGISHIYAQDEHDLFFAQGYNVARDRLFQLEMWRRQATGTVAEILGKKELKRDIGNRLFRFRGDLNQELNWYHPRGAAIIAAFVDGINAYIAETERNPALLPIDFKMLGIKPGKWTSAAVISRFNGLLGNIEQELNIALAVRAIGAENVKDIDYFQPPNPNLEMDPAIDASLLSKEILDLYRAYRTPLKFTPDELTAEYRNPKNAARLEVPFSPIDLSQRREDIGSNNWVVSGRLTESGYPLLMNDPHRVQEAPSLRYWVHLVAPGWNVIGGGEPALPGVSIGHNDFGAWGLTIFGTDSEDLYVYDTNPENPNQYRYQGAWESMDIVRETIPVKDEPPVAVELKYTRHGPVVFEDRAHHKAYAVRAAWREIGGAPYLASLRMDQAHSWQEFRDACAYSRIPAENMVWADRDGNIGYQAVGIAPQRPNWSGLVPVPGDGRYEWDGYLPIKALPNVLNPQKGFYNTSNEYQIPPDWPYKEALHYTWADPYRAQSVAEFLGSGRKFSVADMVQLQNNNLSIPARSLVPLLADLDVSNAAAQKAAERLLHWNFSLDRDSVAAGIYEMFQRRLMANVREVVVPKEARAFIGMPPMSRIVSWMQAPDGRFGSDPIAGRNALLVRSLEEAVAELSRRLGPDMEKWKLGAYHYARILSPMSDAVRPDLRDKFDVGHFPRGGDSYTITATGGGDNQTSGGSFKIVADTENWDNSVGLNNPGQSGDPDDSHYRDLYELWARGKYFPIFYSRAKVDSVAEKVFTLKPANAY